MSSTVTRGRAPSWTAISSARSSHSARPASTESRRVSPPRTTLTGLPVTYARQISATVSSSSSRAATTISPIKLRLGQGRHSPPQDRTAAQGCQQLILPLTFCWRRRRPEPRRCKKVSVSPACPAAYPKIQTSMLLHSSKRRSAAPQYRHTAHFWTGRSQK